MVWESRKTDALRSSQCRCLKPWETHSLCLITDFYNVESFTKHIRQTKPAGKWLSPLPLLKNGKVVLVAVESDILAITF